jgi:hypothetical protein
MANSVNFFPFCLSKEMIKTIWWEKDKDICVVEWIVNVYLFGFILTVLFFVTVSLPKL